MNATETERAKATRTYSRDWREREEVLPHDPRWCAERGLPLLVERRAHPAFRRQVRVRLATIKRLQAMLAKLDDGSVEADMLLRAKTRLLEDRIYWPGEYARCPEREDEREAGEE